MTTLKNPPQPTTCSPWCTDGDGHPDALFHADQACESVETTVRLVRDHTGRDPFGGVVRTQLDGVAVGAWREPVGQVDAVTLRHIATDDETRLTPDEARAVAAALVVWADRLDAEA